MMETLNKEIWKCPKCETLNQENYCVVCGEKKIKKISDDKPTASEPPKKEIHYEPEREKRHPDGGDASKEKSSTSITHKNKIPIVVTLIIVILMMIVIPIAAINLNYYKATQEAKNQNYSEALQYLRGFTTTEGKSLKQECKYQLAVQMLNNGDAQQAKKIFDELGEYKNSAEMVLQCDYDSATWYLSQAKLIEAYEIFERISNFSDSRQKLSEVKAKIYEKGIELYHSEDINEAKTYFEKSIDMGREKDYLLLIQAINGNVDVSQLYALLDFENTKETLLMDKYIGEFLTGRWNNGQNYHIEFFSKDNDDRVWCRYSMPIMPEGEHWKIENGKHYCGSNSEEWIECWSYNIVSQNVIEITVKSNGKRYKFSRI